MWFARTLCVGVLTFLLGGCAAKEAIDYDVTCNYGVGEPQFSRVMGHLLGPPLEEGNRVDTLSNGDEIFPAMLAAIRSAEHTINFETYIYASDGIGEQFAAALEERARAGVQVRIIVDAVGGGKLSRKDKKRLTDVGVKIETYHAVAWYNPLTSARLNNRTHRKLLIIDGRVGFTGGVGVADDWTGDAQDKDHWRDLHYRAEGPIVAQMQAAFTDNWIKTTGEVLNNEWHFPELKPVGGMVAQTFKSGPNGGSESMELMFLLSLAAARETIRIENPYFVPSPLTIKTLRQARDRGVRVQIIVPGPHMSPEIVRPASRSRWGKLLEKGVEIYEYQPTFIHSKLMIVDDQWVSVGSANLDNRSFRLNDEANLNVLDKGFAAEQAKLFEQDLARSKQYTYEQWKSRSFWKRSSEWMVEVLTPLL